MTSQPSWVSPQAESARTRSVYAIENVIVHIPLPARGEQGHPRLVPPKPSWVARDVNGYLKINGALMVPT